MATKTADPLAGIPVAAARTPKAPKAAPAAPSGVINLAAAKKKRKLTGADYQNAKTFAQSMVGYDSTSPIWGKKLIVVLAEISDMIDAGDNTAAKSFVQELQKRIAFGQVMKAQS